MSLRFRLNLFITLMFILILLAGGSYVIHNARVAINEEVNSTASLTLQLIEIGLINASTQNNLEEQNRILEQLANMEGTRHLQIQYIRPSIPEPEPETGTRTEFPISAEAPAWFIKLVKPEPVEFRRVIVAEEIPYTEIIIRANPSDEITEVWNETESVLFLLLIFALIANILVYFTLGRGLAPIESILHGLTGIEKGDYNLRLPRFNLPELSRISEKFNHMAEVLQQSRAENKLLTQRSLAIQEDERRNLAQELHDELGQTITAIKAVAVTIEKQSGSDTDDLNIQAKTIIEYSNHMYSVARSMMHRLRPAILDELGLIKALQDMVDDWNDINQNCFCSFDFSGSFEQLSEAVKINLYRIVQESLTNISKHAIATEASISIQNVVSISYKDFYSLTGIILLIKDNGCGFTTSEIKTGLGLIGMRERIESLNGQFFISSDSGKGTLIEIILPLEKNIEC